MNHYCENLKSSEIESGSDEFHRLISYRSMNMHLHVHMNPLCHIEFHEVSHEDGGSTVLRNVCIQPPHYTV
jgi:hypothetical protein